MTDRPDIPEGESAAIERLACDHYNWTQNRDSKSPWIHASQEAKEQSRLWARHRVSTIAPALRKQGAEELRTAYEKARDQLDEAASKRPELEHMASLLISDGSAETRSNVARDLDQIADILGKLPERAIGDDTHFDRLEAERDQALAKGAEEERERWEINALCEWLQLVAEGKRGQTDVLAEAEGWLLSLLAAAPSEPEEGR